jgi:CheY-like chemotaxis protein
MNKHLCIVIPAGNGQVGTVLSRHFHAQGHEVVVLARKPLPAPWRVVSWDGKNLGPTGSMLFRKAQELKPDLILLDIGLPTLNGIAAARQIRKLSPESKIVFVSQESNADVVQEALSTGAEAYVVKTSAASDLLAAVERIYGADSLSAPQYQVCIRPQSPRQ